jgi:hypothetical protein
MVDGSLAEVSQHASFLALVEKWWKEITVF